MLSVELLENFVKGFKNDEEDCPDHTIYSVVLHNDSLESQIILTSDRIDDCYELFCKIKKLL